MDGHRDRRPCETVAPFSADGAAGGPAYGDAGAPVLPGSGGGNDVGSHCWRTIAIMKHDRLRFIEQVDFVTTPGFLTGPGAREKAGLPPGTGPYRVVTTLGILGYDDQTKRMKLLSTQPGVSVEEVQENTGFDLLLSERIYENPPPTPEELKILREEVDRDKFYI